MYIEICQAPSDAEDVEGEYDRVAAAQDSVRHPASSLFDRLPCCPDQDEKEEERPLADVSAKKERTLKRQASGDVVFKRDRGRCLTAELTALDLHPLHQEALKAAGAVAPVKPAEQLAMLRAEAATRKQKTPAAAVTTTFLGNGWYKEVRLRAAGKQKGKAYVFYTNRNGQTADSRVKLEKLGGHDPAPDGRTLRHAAKKAEEEKKEEEEEKE